ncbi:hypothetical protein WKU33_18565 [Oceanobacillus sp. HCA-5259]|uniref:hypothetical protein n=1 Tax=Oceanobacillus sp. HCA-5259 TaxID=3134661 RepID=UPI0030C0821D
MKFDFKYITQDEREKLYEEVWSNPISVVAKMYGVCRYYVEEAFKTTCNSDPNRGYWTKVRKGEDVKKDKLPGVTKALSKYVRNYAIKYRKDLGDLDETELSNKGDLYLLRGKQRNYLRYMLHCSS